MEDDVIDRIETAFAAAKKAYARPIRLEVTALEYDELSRQFGVPGGIRLYRGRPIVVASEMRWIAE